MSIQIGDRLPAATLHVMTAEGPQTRSTEALFDGRKVVLFAVPGAFTPTCSAQHLPGFIAHADEIRAKGVDDILCLSVNDAFVMGAWGKQHGADDRVTMVADGNGEFTAALGLTLDASGAGLGQRSQRYAMVVNSGVVEQLYVEQPREFKVSSAEAVLAAL